MRNHPTVYNELTDVAGTRNSWEYYFQQPRGRSLEDLGPSPVQIDGRIPAGYPRELGDERYRELWQRFVSLQPEVLNRIEETIENFGINDATLGVHFRGQEMRTAVGHKFPPTLKQMKDAITVVLDQSNFNEILLVTEAEQYVSYMKRAFGSRVRPSPTFRLRHKNSYKIKKPPRKNHRFQLGFEALQDAYLLAASGGLIRGHSGLSEAALLISKEPFKLHVKISQGRNSFRPWVSPWIWYLKAAIPSSLGGFRQITARQVDSFKM